MRRYGEGWVPCKGEEELLEGRRSSRMEGERWSRASLARPNIHRDSAAYTWARYLHMSKNDK